MSKLSGDVNMDSTRTDRIQNAYAEAEARYIAANPASRAAHERATESLPGGNTRSVLHWEPYPLCISSASGHTVRDADGHAYADLLGEYSAGLYGHSHPVLLAALTDTAHQRGVGFGGPHAAEVRLAGLIKKRFFPNNSIEHLRFTNSGTEANLMAIAAAKAFTRRYRGKVVVFEGAYHGGVLVFPVGCAEVYNPGKKEGEKEKRRRRSKYEALRALNAPHDFIVAKYNDLDSVDALIAASSATPGPKTMDEKEENDDDEEGVAAILVEPMLGSGGGVCAQASFLSGLRQRADELGALLILDEVMTSRMFDGGGIQNNPECAIRPDLTTLGKYLGGGASSSGAFGGRADVMALFDPRNPAGALPHAGTFNNNVLSMNAGAVGLEEVFTMEIARRLHELGDEVRDRVNKFANQEGKGKRQMRVLGCGSILAFHFTKTPVEEITSPEDWAGDEDLRLLDLFHLEMLNEGFYLARRGYVALSIPLLLEPEGREALERFVEAVRGFAERFRDLIEQ